MKISRNLSAILISWGVFILFVVLLSIFSLFRIRPIILSYGLSDIEGILLNTANKAATEILDNDNITYDTLARISRNADNGITGIEIDIKTFDLLKCRIADKIYESTSKGNVYDLKLPLGTLLADGYLSGYGPQMTFKMLCTKGVNVSFQNKFTDSGINQTLHQIILNINLSGTVTALGKSQSFNKSVSVLAAQTVIVGDVPDSFTNVEFSGNDFEKGISIPK